MHRSLRLHLAIGAALALSARSEEEHETLVVDLPPDGHLHTVNSVHSGDETIVYVDGKRLETPTKVIIPARSEGTPNRKARRKDAAQARREARRSNA